MLLSLLVTLGCLAAPPDSAYHEGWVAAPGMPMLHYIYKEVTQPEAPVLLLIHGAPGDCHTYTKLLNDKELQGVASIYAVDRFGYGKTTPGQPERSLAMQAKLIAGLLAKLGKPAVVMGHSFGGPVALQLALDYPERVQALVLVAGSVDPSLEKVAWYQRAAQLSWLRWMVPAPLEVCNEEILALPPELERLKPRLATARLPITVLQGGKDNLVPAANADYLQAHLTGSKVTFYRYPALDHFIPFTHPELVRQALLPYLHSPNNQ